MSKKLDRIIAVSKMKYLHDQNAYQTVVKRRTDLTDMINRLDESRYMPENGTGDATMQRHGFQWGRWVDATQAKVNMELFNLAGDEDHKRSQLEKSYGRYLAIDSISKKL